MNTKIEDSNILPIENKHGFYTVGEKLYINKINALEEASKTKQTPTWDFNKLVFEEHCKMPRVDFSLLELYKQRALQLREKYDYLILAFSGGADSDNILQAFIDNNIKLDEVWTDWPIEITEKSGYVLSLSTDPKNMPSEWFLVIEPALKKLKETNPDIKIHVSDSNKFYGDMIFSEEEIMHAVSNPLFFPAVKRYRYIQQYMTTAMLDKNACVIVGMDKCIPYARDGKYGFVISDNAVYIKSNTSTEGVPYTYEFFYWTPDFPQIVIEQARRVWDHIFLNKEILRTRLDQLFRPDTTLWLNREKSLDNIIKLITYPKWDFSKHQVDKSKHMSNDHYHFVNKFSEEKFYQAGQSITKNLFSVLDKQTSYDTRTGYQAELKPFYNFHTLGNITNV